MAHMTGFQRARSAEQREQRRQVILSTAESMLAELPVAEISLNELSRRVGLAKSNVLRYFESREAVLLALLDEAWKRWLDDLAVDLDKAIDPAASVTQRCEQLAAVFAASLAARPQLCELSSASVAVLERNISFDVALACKQSSAENLLRTVELVRAQIGELSVEQATAFVGAAVVFAGAVWTHSRPPAVVEAVYVAHPEFAVMRLDFSVTLRETLATLLAGLLVRGLPHLDQG